MKHCIQIFLLSIGLIHTSCNKEEISVEDQFKGTWEWHSTCGGFVGCIHARNYPVEYQYRIVVDNFTIQTIYYTGDTITNHYQIKNITTQDDLEILEIALDEGDSYSVTIRDEYMTKYYGNGLPISTTYRRVKYPLTSF